MDEAIKIEITGRISGQIATSIRDIAKAAIEADSSLDLLRQSLRDISNVSALRAAVNDTREFRNEVNRATQTTRTFTAATDQSAASLIKASAAADRYGNELNQAHANQRSMVVSGSALGGVMSTLVGTFASFFALQQWVQASDAMVSYENRLKVVGLEGAALDAVMNRIADTALRNGQSMDGLSQLYLKVASAQKDINATGEEMLGFLDAVAAGLRIQGGAANTANGALLQLSQAIGASRVEAQEFNSIVEGMYPIAQAAAKGIDGFAGSVSKLQRFIREGGTITGEQLFRGVLAGLDELQGKVSQTQLTIGQSLQNLRTQFELWTQETQGSAALVSEAIQFIGQNIEYIIPAIYAFAAAWVAVQIASVISGLFGIVSAFVALLPVLVSTTIAVVAAAAPWIALAAAVALVAGGILMATGHWDDFVDWVGKAIKPVTDMAEKLGILGTELEAGKEPADALATTFGGVKTASQDAGNAVEEFGDTTAAAAAKITKANDAAIDSFWRLHQAAKAAASAANDNNYKALVDAGGTKGSFTAVPAAPAAGTSGSSITELPGYNRGGSFKVSGTSRGVDRNLVAFRANRGERVDVLTPAQQRAERNKEGGASNGGGAPILVFNINTPDADSFRRSRQQVAREMTNALAAGS